MGACCSDPSVDTPRIGAFAPNKGDDDGSRTSSGHCCTAPCEGKGSRDGIVIARRMDEGDPLLSASRSGSAQATSAIAAGCKLPLQAADSKPAPPQHNKATTSSCGCSCFTGICSRIIGRRTAEPPRQLATLHPDVSREKIVHIALKRYPTKDNLSSGPDLGVSDDAHPAFVSTPKAANSARAIRHNDARDDWWDEADLVKLGLPITTRLLDTWIVQKPRKTQPFPWLAGQSEDMYRKMGMRDQTHGYVVVWMLIANVAIVTTSQVVDSDVDQQFFETLRQEGAEACLNRRLKLLLSPVTSLQLPESATHPEKAPFVQAFLGHGGSSIHWSAAGGGPQHACIMADFNNKWLLKTALLNFGFREGNVLDLHVVDWLGKRLVASGRLSITKEFLKLIGY